jgi:hypothetical protein
MKLYSNECKEPFCGEDTYSIVTEQVCLIQTIWTLRYRRFDDHALA